MHRARAITTSRISSLGFTGHEHLDSDFNGSISDNSFSVEWAGDGYNYESPSSSSSSRGLYGDGNAQKAHELAQLLMPGYDFGTCISQGDCSATTWGVATIGLIPGSKPAALGVKAVVKSATQIAREGGKHSGQLSQFMKQTPEQLQKTINSFEKQITKHDGWIKDPTSKVKNFNELRPEHQQNLIHHWQQDIARHKELQSIAKDVLRGL